MRVFAVETSCDETSVAVLDEGEVASLRIASQAQLHQAAGGVVPEAAARRHLEVIRSEAEAALTEAACGLQQIDAVAYTRGPGLIGSLLVGSSFAQGLALARGLRVVAVNHVLAHIHAVFIGEVPSFPLVALVVSGGHTSLFRLTAPLAVELLGETRDDAAGEALDKVARMLGLGYPGGAALERLAEHAVGPGVRLPKVRLGGIRPEFSFSGLKTAARQAIVAGAESTAVAKGFQQAVVAQLVDVTRRALLPNDQMLVVGGGVAANQTLGSALRNAFPDLPVHVVPAALSGDNAAMIGRLGWEMLRAGIETPLGVPVLSQWATLT